MGAGRRAKWHQTIIYVRTSPELRRAVGVKAERQDVNLTHFVQQQLIRELALDIQLPTPIRRTSGQESDSGILFVRTSQEIHDAAIRVARANGLTLAQWTEAVLAHIVHVPPTSDKAKQWLDEYGPRSG